MARTPNAVRNQLKVLKSMGFGVLEGVEVPEQPARGRKEPAAEAAATPPRTPDRMDPPAAASILEGESLPVESRIEVMGSLALEIGSCTACRLCQGRTNTVPGEGNPMAELAFVGEGPGRDEDLQGRPFVGRAGELLTKIIEAMKFRRDEVWIGNVVKCRPPGNRPPESDEMESCLPYLQRQLGVIRPRIIVALGKTALTGLLPEHAKTPMGRMRGQWLEWHGIPLMPTFHPAYLLRSPTQKRLVWEDMKLVMKEFGRTP